MAAYSLESAGEGGLSPIGVMGSDGLKDLSLLVGRRIGVRGGSGPTPSSRLLSCIPRLELLVSGSGDSACAQRVALVRLILEDTKSNKYSRAREQGRSNPLISDC